MEREGYRPATTRCAVEALRSLSRRVDLFDIDTVKTYLGKAKVSEGRKERVSNDLVRFYRFKGIPFEKPRYRKIEKLPFIPMEFEVEQLISAMGQKTGTFLQLLRETGIRCGEAWNLKWVDLDSERSTVNVAPEKNSKPRQLKIKMVRSVGYDFDFYEGLVGLTEETCFPTPPTNVSTSRRG
jgi:integrase